METQTNQQTINETAPPPEAPVAQSLLDKIADGNLVSKRDGLLLMRAELDHQQRLAGMFAASGCFADIRGESEKVSIAKAMVKIKLGQSMGFSEAEAMTGIDIIQGRVAVGASLRAARMQRAGFSWPQMTVTDKGCWIPLCFKGEPLTCPKVDGDGTIVIGPAGKPAMVQVIVSYTENDAKSAGLSGKDNYKKDPSSMYFARAITRAQRRYGPGVLGVDVLDTYEAKELSGDDGIRRGTHEDQERVAEEKMAAMEQRGRNGGRTAPGETAADRDARIERQMEEQLKAAKEKEKAEAEKVTAVDLKTFTAETLPDAVEFGEAGAECLVTSGDSKVKMRVIDPGEGQPLAWERVDEPAEQPAQTASTRTKPVFGRKQQ